MYHTIIHRLSSDYGIALSVAADLSLRVVEIAKLYDVIRDYPTDIRTICKNQA